MVKCLHRDILAMLYNEGTTDTNFLYAFKESTKLYLL